MVKKILGYTIALLGVVVILLSFSGVQKALTLEFPDALSDLIIIGIGAVIAIIGAILAGKGTSASNQPAELPIYQGKDVVAFRRMDKK